MKKSKQVTGGAVSERKAYMHECHGKFLAENRNYHTSLIIFYAKLKRSCQLGGMPFRTKFGCLPAVQVIYYSSSKIIIEQYHYYFTSFRTILFYRQQHSHK